MKHINITLAAVVIIFALLILMALMDGPDDIRAAQDVADEVAALTGGAK